MSRTRYFDTNTAEAPSRHAVCASVISPRPANTAHVLSILTPVSSTCTLDTDTCIFDMSLDTDTCIFDMYT